MTLPSLGRAQSLLTRGATGLRLILQARQIEQRRLTPPLHRAPRVPRGAEAEPARGGVRAGTAAALRQTAGAPRQRAHPRLHVPV